MSPRVVLTQISPTAWEHPSEKMAYDAVRKRHSRWGQSGSSARNAEKLRQWIVGDAVRVGPAQRPKLYEIYLDVLKTMDWPNEGMPLPDLYVAARGRTSGGMGGAKPFILLNARHLNMLEREEQRFVVGRAVAQLMSNRLHRREARYVMDCMGDSDAFNIFGMFGGAREMMKWGNSSELSDDRGALLATQDLDSALMALLKQAGGSAKDDSLSVDAWLYQYSAAEEDAAATSTANTEASTAPGAAGLEEELSVNKEGGAESKRGGRLARRALELRKWAASAEYSLIISGAYVRRGQEPVDTAADSAGGGTSSSGSSWFASSNDVKTEAREAVNAVGDVVEKVADSIGEVVTKAADAIGDVFKDSGEGSVGDVVSRAKGAFKDAFKAAQSAAKAAEERMGEAFKDAEADGVVVDYESPASDTESAGATGGSGAGSSGASPL